VLSGILVVYLNTSTPIRVIHYTTDNKIPTSSSQVYNPQDPPKLAGSCVLKAIAIAPNYLDSFISQATYTFTSQKPVVQFYLSQDASSRYITPYYFVLLYMSIVATYPVNISY